MALKGRSLTSVHSAASSASSVPALVLKEVLAALRSPTIESIKWAYLYAGLGLAVNLVASQLNNNKRWFGRRASIRINTELSSQIYQKILVRKNTGTAAGLGKIVSACSDAVAGHERN